MSKFNLTKEQLTELYVQKHMSTREIAFLQGLTRSAILWRLRKWNIPIRGFYDPLVIKQRMAKIFNYSGLKKEESPRWKGGKFKNSRGYIMVLKPPENHRNERYIREHILVWEQENKKRLPEGWQVHHLNGSKDDNRPENLNAMPIKDHAKIIRIFQKRIKELEIELRKERESHV